MGSQRCDLALTGRGSPQGPRLHIASVLWPRLLESSPAVIERRREFNKGEGLNRRWRLFPRAVGGTTAGSEKVLGAQVDDYRRCYGLRLVIGTVDVQAA